MGCRDEHQSEWNMNLPDLDTSAGVQQVLKCMHAFFRLITQDQLPQYRQIQVRFCIYVA